MKRSFSGTTPSSSKGLHLGNYFGAVKPNVEFQKTAESFYFIANIHALNTVFDKNVVEQNTFETYVQFLACGINPKKTTFFVQSDIHAIPYLQTILNNVVTVAELKRMHAYKDKLKNAKSHDQISMGLFSYPVLMSADILAFDADIVPVGEDQTQHVEICREIAHTFNKRYGNILKIPELFVQKEAARIIGIDGQRKMSKSLGNDIPIFAAEKVVKKQIMAITTDPNRIHPTDPGDPRKNVAFSYLQLMDFDSAQLSEMKARYKKGTIGDVEVKTIVFETFMRYFASIRKNYVALMKDKKHIIDIRKTCAEKANAIASTTLQRVKKTVGI
ncbi:tryptophan--tRNA ligase [Candidatus Woesebacteria bacterium]|nr:tryptophan--tRNA ligase [Candidatus Woesebacteria bacterium]